MKLANNYVRVNFGTGPLSAEKLNRMVENMDFLYERMVRGAYHMFGVNKEASVRIQGMLVTVDNTINNVSRYSNCYWPKPFTSACVPIITYGHYFTEAIIHSVGFKNIDGQHLPDHRGFRIEVFANTTEWGDEWRGSHQYSVIGMGY